MKVLGIDHIGVAAKSIDEAAPFWTEVLGLAPGPRETLQAQGVSTLFVPVPGSQIEILESSFPGSAVARFVESRGEGMQHLALRVENIEEALGELKDKGVRLIDEHPRAGAGGTRVAFIHPRSTHGILLELVEHPPVNA